MHVGADEEIDRVVVDVLGQPVLDGQDKGGDAALAVAFGQCLGVRADRRLGLAVEQAGRGPPQEKGKRHRADGEQDRIDDGEAERRGAKQPGVGAKPRVGRAGPCARFGRDQAAGRQGGRPAPRQRQPPFLSRSRRAACSRRCGPCGSAASGRACPLSGAGATRGRRSRWSAGRNGNPRRPPAAWSG